MTITSVVLSSFSPLECFPHEPEYLYLFSPVASWDGSVSIGDRSVHRGSVRPGMLRLSTGQNAEAQTLPRHAKALVIRIPENQLKAVFDDLNVKVSAADVVLTPIDIVDSRVLKLVQVLATHKSLAEESQTVITEGITRALLDFWSNITIAADVSTGYLNPQRD